MNTEIVSNSKQQIVDMGSFSLVYIPLSGEERAIFNPSIVNPCWRIEVANGEVD
jgi:hypothetical protein